jgi:spore coat protein U-like protein
MSAFRNSAGWLVRGVIATLACAVAQPVYAQTISQEQYAYYRDPLLPNYAYPGPAQAVLSIPVRASVGGSCGFQTAPNANLNVGQIDTTAWDQQVAFVPECTAPWRIAVKSVNGGLKTAATVPVGYQNKAPYTVSLNVASDSGPVTGSCPVAQIDQAAGSTPCTFEGTASSANGLLIPRSFGLLGSFIRMNAPAYPGPDILVSGTYTDTLVVTISPAS